MGNELKVVKCTDSRCYTGTDGELKKRGVWVIDSIHVFQVAQHNMIAVGNISIPLAPPTDKSLVLPSVPRGSRAGLGPSWTNRDATFTSSMTRDFPT